MESVVTPVHERDDGLWIGQIDAVAVAVVTTDAGPSRVHAITRRPLPNTSVPAAKLVLPRILARGAPGFVDGEGLSATIDNDAIVWQAETPQAPATAVAAIVSLLADPAPGEPELRTKAVFTAMDADPRIGDSTVLALLGAPGDYQWVIESSQPRDQVLRGLAAVLEGGPQTWPAPDFPAALRGDASTVVRVLGPSVSLEIKGKGADSVALGALLDARFDIIEEEIHAEGAAQSVEFDCKRFVGIELSTLGCRGTHTDRARAVGQALHDRLETLYDTGVGSDRLTERHQARLGPALSDEPAEALRTRLFRGETLLPLDGGHPIWIERSVTLDVGERLEGDGLLPKPSLVHTEL